jgi:conjugal transfer pilus assembly protein TraE
MKTVFKEKNLEHLLFQRNIFAALCVILALTVLLQSAFLFSKKERVVITPPFIEKSFWVDSSTISPTYLEQFGVFLGQNLLSKTSASSPGQRNLLLRHTSPAFSGILKQRLLDEEEVLKKQMTSYTFFTKSVDVDINKMSVILSGARSNYANGHSISNKDESYELSFIFSGGRLLLNGVKILGGGN